MKISVSAILRDHLLSLYDDRTMRLSLFDVALFYGIPVIGALICYFRCLKLSPDVYNTSITFFGIFIALLLNIQVAMFSIYQRKWDAPNAGRSAHIQDRALDLRRQLLSEINANISYLVLICCLALFVVLLFYIAKASDAVAPAVVVFLYVHFLLTLLMIVKRSHALFQKEYRDSPG